VLISLQAHETMLLRSAVNRLKVEGVYPLSLSDLTFDISSVDVDPVARETVENILIQAARFSSGIWSMHYQNLAESIRSLEPPQSDAGLVSVPLGYEPDPSKSFTSISSNHSEAAVRSLNEHSEAWREGLFKGRFWRSSTQHLLESVYLPRFELLSSQADRMTKGAIDVYAQALRNNLDVISAFGLKDGRGRPNKNFLKLAEPISLVYGIQLFNRSLERLYADVFRGSTTHAAEALIEDEVVEPRLKEWAFVHRWKGFYAPTFHGELALRMLGSSEETFLRLERAGEVDESMKVLDYLLNQVQLSDTDYIAHHARYAAIADVANRMIAISSDASVRMTLEEWRAEAEASLEELENHLSPFPRDDWSRGESRGVLAHISSASGWKGPSDHDDDPPPAA
jgi:hypothetical protein